MDTMWLLVCSALIMLMQAGFLCLETGLTRSKNNINVAVKNLTDLGVSLVAFWAVGYGLMYGSSQAGWLGSDRFALDLSAAPAEVSALFLFQALFCGAAVTIMSGAVAERLRFGWYVGIAVVLTAFIYPVLGHWIWNESGWLAERGFVDFAGATVVHSLGGWAGLAAIMILGPRRGRFVDGQPAKIAGSNVPLATLGALLLWCGWVGFNGGSLLVFDGRVSGITANTGLAGAGGLMTALLVGWWRTGQPRVVDPINGMLAGLVAVTASVNAISSAAALLIGIGGALCMLAVERGLEWRQIDDAVGAVPVHLGAGIWGTLAVAIFADPRITGLAGSFFDRIAVQAMGAVVAGVWVFGLVWGACRVLNIWVPMRVTEEAEAMGLNVAEHGASTDLADLFHTMEAQASSGDLSLRVTANSFSEAGQIGQQYNRVISALQQTQNDLQASEVTASRDPLTETLNRRGLVASVHALGSGARTVLMFDVVRFGSINGTLGYSAGDDVLVEISRHVGRRLGPDWSFGRWGGDEFVAIAPGHRKIEPALITEVPCRIDSGGQVTVSLRAGLVHVDGAQTADEIMRKASYALDESKRNVKAIVEFDTALAQRYQRSMDLVASLGNTLSESRIVPVAQTILSGDRIVGAELLARWRNDDGSLGSPAEFIPALIENALMDDLDRFMIDEAAAFAARLGGRDGAPWVSVNVSAPNLAGAGFVEHVASALRAHQLEPDRFIIEITETEQVLAPELWLSSAHRLRSLGVGLAVDDFGSGYSGIERMSLVPITHVKFDREMVNSATGPIGGVMQSVVDYAKKTGIVPIAEGVETRYEQMAMSSLGIEVMQGFLFSHPRPLDEVAAAILDIDHNVRTARR